MTAQEYYDYVLASIPLIGLTLWAILRALGYSHSTAVSIACLAIIAVVGHALFIDPPTGPRRPNQG